MNAPRRRSCRAMRSRHSRVASTGESLPARMAAASAAMVGGVLKGLPVAPSGQAEVPGLGPALSPGAGAASSSAATKRAGSSARESSPASRSITPSRSASSDWRRLPSVMAEAYYGRGGGILDNAAPSRVLAQKRSPTGTASDAGRLPAFRKENTMLRMRTVSWLVLGLAVPMLLAATPALAQKKTLVVALNQDPDLLDPTLSRTYVGPIIFAHMCEKLYDIDENLRIIPQLAAAMPTISDGGKTVTIKLRSGVKFNDGTPMTAEAVKFSLDRHREMKGSNRRSELEPVTSVEVVDPL